MILLPYGFQNQRTLLSEVLLNIEKDLRELEHQKIVLSRAFNCLNSDKDDILENTSILGEETKKILQNRTLNLKQ